MSVFPQRCKVCGCRDRFNFTVSDEVWERVVPEPFRSRVVCLGCFDAFASQRGVRYASELNSIVQFVGDEASLTLQVMTWEEAPS